jgi:hypothetical protein
MQYEDTMQMGDQQPPRQPSDEDRPTEVMPGMAPEYPPPPTIAPQEPVGAYQPQPIGPAKTEIMYKPPSVMAWLAVKGGPRTGKLYRLSPDVTAIGRDSHNDIIIDDTAASRQHAKVKLEKGDEDAEQFYVYDLATSNGTILNGKQIAKEALYDGDEIEIGRTALVFKQIDGPKRATEGSPPEEAAESEGG